MSWLWRQMLARVGSVWTREYGEAGGATSEIWRDALGGLTSEQLKRGVDACAKWENDFPPNLGQFTKLCLTTNENSPEVQKYLNAPEATPITAKGMEVIEGEMTKIRRTMSTERDADFVRAYYACGLQSRWGSLDPKKEAEYLARGKA